MKSEHSNTENSGAPEASLDPDSDLPHLEFSTFTLGIIGSAYVHLGDAPTPEGEQDQDLELARHDIEILQMLLEKTKGNLTGDEERLLSQALSDLKSRYVELRKA